MPIATDPLSLVFLTCFLFGLLFLLFSAILGSLGHMHIGGTHGMGHGGHAHIASHAPTHGGSAHVASHAPTHSAGQTGHTTATTTQQGGHAQGQQGLGHSLTTAVSYLNFSTLIFFLIGFGLVGYVFKNALHPVLQVSLLAAAAGGILVAILLLVMIALTFGNSEGETVQDVSDRTGLLAKVGTTIQANGLGEVIYVSPGGMRKSIPARALNDQRLERGQEVVIINYQHGVAEVETWEAIINSDQPNSADLAPHEENLEKLRSLLDEPDPVNLARHNLAKE